MGDTGERLMDDQRFDQIARMLGSAPTRRGALRLPSDQLQQFPLPLQDGDV